MRSVEKILKNVQLPVPCSYLYSTSFPFLEHCTYVAATTLVFELNESRVEQFAACMFNDRVFHKKGPKFIF